MDDRGDQPFEIALAHAERRWEAEVENARRYATRANGILALVTGFLSLGLFKLGALEDIQIRMTRAAVGFLLVGGLISAFWALLKLLQPTLEELSVDPDGQQRPTASDALNWPADELAPFEIDEKAASVVVFNSLYEAAKELQDQNRAKKNKIDEAQRTLQWAAGYLAAALVWYLVATGLGPEAAQ